MIQGILLGFGIGLAAYGCSRLLFGVLWSKDEPEVEESQVVLNRSEIVEPVAPVEPVREEPVRTEPVQTPDAAETSLPEPEEASAPVPVDIPVAVEEALPEVSEEPPAPHLDSGAEAATENQEGDAKSWYLIATNKGKLRALKCSSWTAHAVAGPFATKKEAQQAKQQHE